MSGNTSSPSFSVVIPVRNGEPYIEMALTSVLNQTYQNFNAVVLENCSQDHTIDIINSFNDSRITVIPAGQPLSIERNWARILDLGLNEYMVTLCHDDLLYPEFLQQIALLIEAEPGATVYHAHFELIDHDGKLVRKIRPIAYRETGDEFLSAFHHGEEFGENVTGTGYVVRSADYKRVGGLPELSHLFFADVVCWYRLAQLGYKVCHPQTLSAFRVNIASTGKTTNLVEAYAGIRQYWQILRESGYLVPPDQKKLASRFLSAFFNYRLREVLVDLIGIDDPVRLSDYTQMRRKLVELAEDDTPFVLFNSQARIYEAILHMPFYPLRRLLHSQILAARDFKTWNTRRKMIDRGMI